MGRSPPGGLPGTNMEGMNEKFEQAGALLRQFKGEAYVHGIDVFGRLGGLAAGLGRRALVVRDAFPGSERWTGRIIEALEAAGVELAGIEAGAAPNAPLQDLDRIASRLRGAGADVVVSFGGGSTIDAVKAAAVLASLGGQIEDYFGTGLVSAAMMREGRQLIPHLAIQSAASSGAHLTKYSNITNLASGQKKLVVDLAVVPARALFDYSVTLGAPETLTVDGALDGISHCLEVLYGAVGQPAYDVVERVAEAGIRVLMKYLPAALREPSGAEAREALGLGTDLGAYAIMLGGTNGAHLTSFSLIDILSHGRACAILNPYYTVFFAPAIERPLRLVASICAEFGYAGGETLQLTGRDLGIAVGEALIRFERSVGLEPSLNRVPGFTAEHIRRALAAAKSPQLRMKLENMPVPLTPEMVDEYMGPVLEAAASGRLELIRNVA